MFFTRLLLAKPKAKQIVVILESMVTGHKTTAVRDRLGDKLEQIRFDPYTRVRLQRTEEIEKSPGPKVGMSFLQRIQQKRDKLSHCSTTITQLTGEKYLEDVTSSGVSRKKIAERPAGYIIDLKPDLSVAEILYFLFLSSQDVPTDLITLKNLKITHVLSVGARVPPIGHLTFKFIDLLDEPNSNLTGILSETNEFIDMVRESAGRVLVHCNAGCSRAPSVVIGYLMYHCKWSYREAFQFVGDKRYIRPNEGFIVQLKKYDPN